MSLVFLFICFWYSFFHKIHYIIYWGYRLNLFYLLRFLLLKFQFYFSCISVSLLNSSFVCYIDFLIIYNSLFLLSMSSFKILFLSSIIKHSIKFYMFFFSGILSNSLSLWTSIIFSMGRWSYFLDLSSFLFYSIEIYASGFFVDWVYQLFNCSQTIFSIRLIEFICIVQNLYPQSCTQGACHNQIFDYYLYNQRHCWMGFLWKYPSSQLTAVILLSLVAMGVLIHMDSMVYIRVLPRLQVEGMWSR